MQLKVSNTFFAMFCNKCESISWCVYAYHAIIFMSNAKGCDGYVCAKEKRRDYILHMCMSNSAYSSLYPSIWTCTRDFEYLCGEYTMYVMYTRFQWVFLCPCNIVAGDLLKAIMRSCRWSANTLNHRATVILSPYKFKAPANKSGSCNLSYRRKIFVVVVVWFWSLSTEIVTVYRS